MKHNLTAQGLKKEEFERLSLCDGLHDIPEDELTESLVQRRMIFPTEKGKGSLPIGRSRWYATTAICRR